MQDELRDQLLEELAKKKKVDDIDKNTLNVKFQPRIAGDMARGFIKKDVHLENRGLIMENYPRRKQDAQKFFYYVDESEIKRIMNKRKQADAHKKKSSKQDELQEDTS